MERISNQPKHNNLISGIKTSDRQTRERVTSFDSMVSQQMQLKEEVNQRSADKLSQKDFKTALGQKSDSSDNDDHKRHDEFHQEVADGLSTPDLAPISVEAPDGLSTSDLEPILVDTPETHTNFNLTDGAQPAVADVNVETEGKESEIAAAAPENLLAAGAQAEQPLEKLPTGRNVDSDVKTADPTKSPLTTPDALTPGSLSKAKTETDVTSQKLSARMTEESADELISRPNAILTSAVAAEVGKEVKDAPQSDVTRSDRVVADLKAAAEKSMTQDTEVGEETDSTVVKLTEVGQDDPEADSAQRPRQDVQSVAVTASQRPISANSAVQPAKPSPVAPVDISTSSPSASQTANAREAARSQTPQHSRQAAGQQPVIDQVSIQIRKAVKEGLDRIQIQLEPADLGRIDVTMEVANDGKVMAVVKADNPETLDLMMKDARSLERALADAGLDVDSNSLEFELSDQGTGQNTGEENELAHFVGADLVAASETEEFIDIAVEGDSDYGLMADGDGLDLYA